MALTSRRLAEIRQHVATIRARLRMPDEHASGIYDVRNPEPEPTPDVPVEVMFLGMDVLELLADVKRLRHEVADLKVTLRHEREFAKWSRPAW